MGSEITLNQAAKAEIQRHFDTTRPVFMEPAVKGNGGFKLVVLESPYANRGVSMSDEERERDIERNVEYARACMHDCLVRSEAPYASHLLYTQPGVLKDGVPEERKLGIEAGLAWGAMAHKTVVYTDRGITVGMRQGIDRARKAGRPIVYRSLGGVWEKGA